MDRRILVMGLVTVLALTCALPIASEDSDAAVTERQVSSLYVLEATIESASYSLSSSGSHIMLIEGTENYSAMQRYLKDPYHNDLAGDDSDIIRDKIGSKLYIYSISPYLEFTSGNHNYSDTEKVLDGMPITFFVKGGDKFTFELLAMDIYGEYYSSGLYVSYRGGSEYMDAGDDVTFTQNTNTIVNAYCNAIYCDITYEAEGFSTPNGSSTLFAVVCIFVSAVILAIMVIAGLRPKWGE